MSDYRVCLNAVDQAFVSPMTAPVMNDGCQLALLAAIKASEVTVDESHLPLSLQVHSTGLSTV